MLTHAPLSDNIAGHTVQSFLGWQLLTSKVMRKRSKCEYELVSDKLSQHIGVPYLSSTCRSRVKEPEGTGFIDYNHIQLLAKSIFVS